MRPSMIRRQLRGSSRLAWPVPSSRGCLEARPAIGRLRRPAVAVMLAAWFLTLPLPDAPVRLLRTVCADTAVNRSHRGAGIRLGQH